LLNRLKFILVLFVLGLNVSAVIADESTTTVGDPLDPLNPIDDIIVPNLAVILEAIALLIVIGILLKKAKII
jgi:hypothetical protein